MYQEASMLSPKHSRKALTKLFKKKYVADIDQLFHTLDTRSRMSIFRRLRSIGYFSSFTDCGRYYTLSNIPKFDSFGLWFYQDIGFSKAGTLKSTVIDIVSFSEAGMTPKEILNLLRLRSPNSLHNALRDLIKEKYLSRNALKGLSLYISYDSDIADKQIEVRRKKTISRVKSVAIPSAEIHIAVLVEALKAGKTVTPPSVVSARLIIMGMAISVDQVEQIYNQYDLSVEKKTAEQP